MSLFSKVNYMKNLIIFLGIIIFLRIPPGCKKQDTGTKSDTSATEIAIHEPLIDFGDSTFRGFTGGLYINGSNERPAEHNMAGVAIAKSIKLLNNSGIEDDVNGKIVWLSIGMSHTTLETEAFFTSLLYWIPLLILILSLFWLMGLKAGRQLMKLMIL